MPSGVYDFIRHYAPANLLVTVLNKLEEMGYDLLEDGWGEQWGWLY